MFVGKLGPKPLFLFLSGTDLKALPLKRAGRRTKGRKREVISFCETEMRHSRKENIGYFFLVSRGLHNTVLISH